MHSAPCCCCCFLQDKSHKLAAEGVSSISHFYYKKTLRIAIINQYGLHKTLSSLTALHTLEGRRRLTFTNAYTTGHGFYILCHGAKASQTLYGDTKTAIRIIGASSLRRTKLRQLGPFIKRETCFLPLLNHLVYFGCFQNVCSVN